MAKAFETDKFAGKLAVVTGFFAMPTIEVFNDYDLIILLGGITDSSNIIEAFEKTKTLTSKYIYVLSYKDLLYADYCGFNPESFELIQWLAKQYISATVTFANFSRYIFTGGSVLPEMKNWDKDKTNFKLAYERDDINWAQGYDGRFGYAVSAKINSNDIQYHQHTCIIGRGDKPIILNVDRQGIEYLET